MSQIQLVNNSGQEMTNLLVNSGILNLSHKAILSAYEDINNSTQSPSIITHRVHKESNFTIITFLTCISQQHLEHQQLLSVDEIFLPFKFLNSIAIHKAAITLFASYQRELSKLKDQYGNFSPLIVTGHSLGGSIAALFTLWLLENINQQNSERPLCITFGAPLLGDKLLEKFISEQPKWNSCFLHVAATRDQIPRLFMNNSSAFFYKPFGMYLLCSGSGCGFLELSEGIAKVLVAMNNNLQHDEEFSIARYGEVIRDLESKVICRGTSHLGEVNRMRAGITLQLEGIGLKKTQQQINNVNDLIAELEKLEVADVIRKRKIVDPGKQLNTMKLKMAQLEGYKKKANNNEMCYYDSYKNMMTTTDQDVIHHQRFLSTYWKQTIKDSDNPRSGVALDRTRWLFGGTCYRRMVEPFDIAEFYKVKGRRDYISNGRSEHYKKLEKLLAEVGKCKDDNSTLESKKENVDVILTEDSCFWARVEEALISCECLSQDKNDYSSRQDLIMFEEYVVNLMKNYTVSPEIFFPKSTFMEWWRRYEKIKGMNYNSDLTEIMRKNRYKLYAKGKLEL